MEIVNVPQFQNSDEASKIATVITLSEFYNGRWKSLIEKAFVKLSNILGICRC